MMKLISNRTSSHCSSNHRQFRMSKEKCCHTIWSLSTNLRLALAPSVFCGSTIAVPELDAANIAVIPTWKPCQALHILLFTTTTSVETLKLTTTACYTTNCAPSIQ